MQSQTNRSMRSCATIAASAATRRSLSAARFSSRRFPVSFRHRHEPLHHLRQAPRAQPALPVCRRGHESQRVSRRLPVRSRTCSEELQSGARRLGLVAEWDGFDELADDLDVPAETREKVRARGPNAEPMYVAAYARILQQRESAVALWGEGAPQVVSMAHEAAPDAKIRTVAGCNGSRRTEAHDGRRDPRAEYKR